MSTPVSQRRDFVEDAQRGVSSMRERFARHGISWRVGYRWLAPHAAGGLNGLRDLSRRPQHSPTELAPRDPTLVALVLAVRERHSTWGLRKLLAHQRSTHAAADR